jgi:hypothetical protein
MSFLLLMITFLLTGETYFLTGPSQGSFLWLVGFRSVHQRACHSFQITIGDFQGFQITSGDFQGKQDCDCHEIKHVAHSASGKGALELINISNVRKRDNARGNRRADIGTHYEKYTAFFLERQYYIYGIKRV